MGVTEGKERYGGLGAGRGAPNQGSDRWLRRLLTHDVPLPPTTPPSPAFPPKLLPPTSTASLTHPLSSPLPSPPMNRFHTACSPAASCITKPCHAGDLPLRCLLCFIHWCMVAPVAGMQQGGRGNNAHSLTRLPSTQPYPASPPASLSWRCLPRECKHHPFNSDRMDDKQGDMGGM